MAIGLRPKRLAAKAGAAIRLAATKSIAIVRQAVKVVVLKVSAP